MNALTRAAWEFKRQFIREVVIEERKIRARGAMQRAAVRLGVHRNTVCRVLKLKELKDERDPPPLTSREVSALQEWPHAGTAKMSRLRKANESVPPAGDESTEVCLPVRASDRKVRFML
jgi:hypothetical protein